MKPNMTIEEAIEFADEWSRGITLHAGSQGWRVVCLVLAEEVRRLHRIEASARNLIDALGKLDEGCRDPGWRGWENGHGEQVGDAAQEARKELAAQLINTEAKGPRSGPA